MEGSDSKNYFSHQTIDFIKEKINEYNGNEVFFAGEIDFNGIVISARDSAHGNIHSVPVQAFEKRKCSVLIHNHPSGNLVPSDADIAVAQEASENAQGFYIINNDCSNVYIVCEPVKPKKIHKLNEEKTSFYLTKDGPLKKLSEFFEERPVQIELLKKITRTFNENGIGVFEAGTGVGKSYAYLIPSMLWALKNNERVVVSTGTINLQQQLCEKDIPMAEKIIGKSLKFMLLKGRQNFLCKRRFYDALNQRELFDDNNVLDEIYKWAESTKSGSKSELSFMPPENVWQRINSESDACMSLRCPYHADCFVMMTRKEASSANILVVNHHLLFADIDSRLGSGSYEDAAVLPPYKRIVFDEAHGIEKAATSFFSESFNRFKILRQINVLYRKRKNSESGYLCTLAILSSAEEQAFSAYEMVNRIKTDLSNLETCALDLLSDDYTLRLSDSTERAFAPFLSLALTLSKSISDFVSLCREIMEGLTDEEKDVPVYWETKMILRRLEDVCVILQDFSSWDEKRDNVFWIQKRKLSLEAAKDSENPFYVVFSETPLEIGNLMNRGVFEPMESVVCTSATLKTGKDFSYWIKRVGLNFVENERILIGEFPSPFPFKQNMIFAVPSDAPFPDDVKFQVWIEAAISELIVAADGRTLVLFTSYESLRSAYNSVSVKLARRFDGSLLRQGSDDSARLLELFKRETKSVLFATDSFWQGVDVPGESLSQVIIVKLPFTVPNDPVFTARAEAIEKRGGSSFMDLSVPEAVIKFRQGIGRLLRRETDKGAVIVLDRRIYEKRYGSIFLSNVPDCKRLYEPLEKISSEVADLIFGSTN